MDNTVSECFEFLVDGLELFGAGVSLAVGTEKFDYEYEAKTRSGCGYQGYPLR